jgi:hypothetical protein
MSQPITVDLDGGNHIGQNIVAVETDGKLVLVIDTSVDLGASSTGKMNGIASTGGFVQLPGGMKLNLYLGRKA